MKNQTLEIGSYLIPEGCKATVMGGEVIISIKKDNRIKEGDWRCKDCIHRKEGKTSINAWSMSWVCELKPKTVRNPRFANQKLFYCANRNDKACENFERKEHIGVNGRYCSERKHYVEYAVTPPCKTDKQ